jgi:penicillin amidase
VIAPWRVKDSLAIGLCRASFQTRKTFVDDLKHAKIRARIGSRRYQALFGDSRDEQAQTTIIKRGELSKTQLARPAKRTRSSNKRNAQRSARSARLGASLETSAAFLRLLEAPIDIARAGGSNSWVIDKKHSRSGYALLANDPHLTITNPPFWHESHIHVSGGLVTPLSRQLAGKLSRSRPRGKALAGEQTLHVSGLTLAGLPTILVGHNEDVAWGVTNGYSNAADLVLIEPDANGRFALDGKTYQIERYRPLVRVKAGPLYVRLFRGARALQARPDIANCCPRREGRVERTAAAFAWSGFHIEEPAIAAMMKLMRARNVEQADRALQRFRLPCFNFVFADRHGDIGYRQVGLVPRRKADSAVF